MIRAYYGLQVYGEYANTQYPGVHEVPEGTLVYVTYTVEPGFTDQHWYTSDLVPLAEEDVPRELRALQMILGNSRTM